MLLHCPVCETRFKWMSGRTQHIYTAKHQKNCGDFLKEMMVNTCKLTTIQERKMKIAKEDFGKQIK